MVRGSPFIVVRYGAGQHLKTLDPEDIERFLQVHVFDPLIGILTGRLTCLS